MPQQHQLRLTGVLELIEQNGPKPLAFHRTDVGKPLRQGGRKSHLVREVERITAALQLEVTIDQRQHLTTRLQRGQGVGHRPRHRSRTAGPWRQPEDPGLEPVDQPLQIRRHPQMLGHLPGQVDHGMDDR